MLQVGGPAALRIEPAAPDGGVSDAAAPGLRAFVSDETGSLGSVEHELAGEAFTTLGTWELLVLEVWGGTTPRVRAQLGSASLAETALVDGSFSAAGSALSVGAHASIGPYTAGAIGCAVRYDDVLVHVE
jgi:hypothetical protein